MSYCFRHVICRKYLRQVQFPNFYLFSESVAYGLLINLLYFYIVK